MCNEQGVFDLDDLGSDSDSGKDGFESELQVEPVRSSMPPPEFLIDANCLMDPFNNYYGPQFALSEGFWNRMRELVETGRVGILDVVRDETYSKKKDSSDKLDIWLAGIDSHVISTRNSLQIIRGYGEVINLLGTDREHFQPLALTEWSKESVADPWIIAAAQHMGSTVITFENYVQFTPNQPTKKPKIPTVAKFFDVSCMTLFEFMRKVSGF
jgi:hypothetical protein